MTLNSNRVHLNINEVVAEFFLCFLRTVIKAILKMFGSMITFKADLTSTKGTPHIKHKGDENMHGASPPFTLKLCN